MLKIYLVLGSMVQMMFLPLWGDLALQTLQKKWNFPLRMYSVNVTKSGGNCGFELGFDQILNFLCSVCITPSRLKE